MVTQKKNMSKTNIIRIEGTHGVNVFQVQLYLVPRFVKRLPSFQMVFGRDFVQAGQQQRILGHALNGHLWCDRRKSKKKTDYNRITILDDNNNEI